MRRLCACYLLCWACLLHARTGRAACPAGTPSAAPLSTYGPEAGDTVLTVTSSQTVSARIELPKPFVYANKEFSNVYVSKSLIAMKRETERERERQIQREKEKRCCIDRLKLNNPDETIK